MNPWLTAYLARYLADNPGAKVKIVGPGDLATMYEPQEPDWEIIEDEARDFTPERCDALRERLGDWKPRCADVKQTKWQPTHWLDRP